MGDCGNASGRETRRASIKAPGPLLADLFSFSSTPPFPTQPLRYIVTLELGIYTPWFIQLPFTMAPIHFFGLPLEIRQNVYKYALKSGEIELEKVGGYLTSPTREVPSRRVPVRIMMKLKKYPALLRVNHQICADTGPILLANITLSIEYNATHVRPPNPISWDLDLPFEVGSLRHCLGSEPEQPLINIQYLTLEKSLAKKSHWFRERFRALKSVTFFGWDRPGSIYLDTTDTTDKAPTRDSGHSCSLTNSPFTSPSIIRSTGTAPSKSTSRQKIPPYARGGRRTTM